MRINQLSRFLKSWVSLSSKFIQRPLSLSHYNRRGAISLWIWFSHTTISRLLLILVVSKRWILLQDLPADHRSSSTTQMSTAELVDQLKNQLARAYAKEFLWLWFNANSAIQSVRGLPELHLVRLWFILFTPFGYQVAFRFWGSGTEIPISTPNAPNAIP